jgi:hypothetical protein
MGYQPGTYSVPLCRTTLGSWQLTCVQIDLLQEAGSKDITEPLI